MPIDEEKLQTGIDTMNMPAMFNRKCILNSILDEPEIANKMGEESAEVIAALVEPYSKRLRLSYSVVEQSLFALLGHKSGGYPTWKDCRRVNSIMASNVIEMRMGNALREFTGVDREEWTPMVVVDGYRDTSRRAVLGYTFSFLAMAGYAATQEFKEFFPGKGFFYKGHTGMFDLAASYYESVTFPESYLGMWTWAFLDPALEWGAFERLECNSAFTTHNRKLFRVRQTPCEYGRNNKCSDCPVGMESCYRATHRGEHIQKMCHHCGKLSLFSKDKPEAPRCIRCSGHDFVERKARAITKKGT